MKACASGLFVFGTSGGCCCCVCSCSSGSGKLSVMSTGGVKNM